MRISDLIGLGRSAVKFSVLPLLFLLIAWGLVYKLIYKTILHGKRSLPLKKAAACGVCLAVILVIVYATLLRGGYWGGAPSLMPFASYQAAWYQFHPVEWRNLILNICMFVPFGLMLPVASEKFRKPWKTYLAGFAFTLLIEMLQIVFKRGIFETDDLINNLLGTIIGYGLFSLIFAAVKRRFSGKILLLQIPLLLTVLSFALTFTAYYRKDLGNMIYENTSSHKMPVISVGEGVELSSEETTGNVYRMKIASVEETRLLAEKVFAAQGDTVDESRTDIYDETALYYSRENALSLSIDYKGMTVTYVDFDLKYPQDGSKFRNLAGAGEQRVREAVEKLGFTIPETAFLDADREGEYFFEAEEEVPGEHYCTGIVRCELSEQGEAAYLWYDIITGEPYKQLPVLSSREAYDILCSGEFYYEMGSVPNDAPLTVTGLELVYLADSKGFYQPAYRFTLDNGRGEELRIHIPALQS